MVPLGTLLKLLEGILLLQKETTLLADYPIRTAIRQRLPTRTTSRLYLQHKLSSGVPIGRAPLTLATMYLYTDAGINVSLATLPNQTTG